MSLSSKIVFMACCVLLGACCNTEEKGNKSIKKEVVNKPAHVDSGLGSKFAVFLGGNDSLVLQDFYGAPGNYIVWSQGTKWYVKAGDKIWEGYYRSVLRGVPDTAEDSNKGAMIEWEEDSLSLNGTTIRNGDISNQEIFPSLVDTLVVSPDNKYIAIEVGLVEANPVIDIIDVKELIKTGHYHILREIDPSPGEISGKLKWEDDKLILKANIDITRLNSVSKMSDTIKIEVDDYNKYDYNMATKKIEEYKTN